MTRNETKKIIKDWNGEGMKPPLLPRVGKELIHCGMLHTRVIKHIKSNVFVYDSICNITATPEEISKFNNTL